MKIPEKDIQQAIIEYLEFKKYLVFRTNSGDSFIPCGNGRTRRIKGLPKGFPDLMVMYNDPDLDIGITDFIEVKSEKGKLNPDQKSMHSMLVYNGFMVYVFHSIDECMEIF